MSQFPWKLKEASSERTKDAQVAVAAHTQQSVKYSSACSRHAHVSETSESGSVQELEEHML